VEERNEAIAVSASFFCVISRAQ